MPSAGCQIVKERGIEAVAILLLHSYRNPTHEIRVKELVREELPDVFVSASHELSQEYREFERASTVVANADVGPRVAEYLAQLEQHLKKQGFGGDFFVVQSTGGLFPIEHARRDCVRMLEIRARGWCDWRAGHLCATRSQRRDCLRYGRHHGEGWRD